MVVFAPAFTGRMGREPLTWARGDFTSCSNFRCFFAFPVSGSEAVSIRNLRREGRHASACSNFSVVRSAFRLACVALLSLISGGGSSAVNSSLEGFFRLNASAFCLHRLFLGFCGLMETPIVLVSAPACPAFVLCPPRIPFCRRCAGLQRNRFSGIMPGAMPQSIL